MKIDMAFDEAARLGRAVELDAEAASGELAAALRALAWLTSGVRPGEARALELDVDGAELHGLFRVLGRTAEAANRRYL